MPFFFAGLAPRGRGQGRGNLGHEAGCLNHGVGRGLARAKLSQPGPVQPVAQLQV